MISGRFACAALCIPALIAWIGCGQEDNDRDVHRQIVIEKVAAFGYAEDVENDSAFGHIADIVPTSDGGVLVLDKRMMQVKAIDSTGAIRRVIQLKEGQGPGELTQATTIDVGPDGRIYITDIDQTMNVYEPDGSFVRTAQLGYIPVGIEVIDSLVYVMSFWTQADSILHQYSSDGTLRAHLVPRPDNWEEVMRYGFFGNLATDADEHLIYSHPTPYRIIRMDNEGRVLAESSGAPEFTLEPSVREGQYGKVYGMNEGARDVTVLPDGHVLSLVMRDEDSFVDVFDRDLRFVERVGANRFGLRRFTKMTSDTRGFLYLDEVDSIPSVHKYRFRIAFN